MLYFHLFQLLNQKAESRLTLYISDDLVLNLDAGGIRLKETDFTIPGPDIGPPVSTPVGAVGMAIVSFQKSNSYTGGSRISRRGRAPIRGCMDL